jgi:SAM-dependent methyltransferase
MGERPEIERLQFERAVAPDALTTSEVTDLLYERLDPGVRAIVESRLNPEERALWEGRDEATRRRLVLQLGTHFELEQVLERTGLTPVQPPDAVHAVSRGAWSAGGRVYYADLVVDAVRCGGADPAEIAAALDFGCSSGRVVRTLAAAYPNVEWHGCDPNERAIGWASENLPGIAFVVSPQKPPLPYDDARFDLVFAISIWSHFGERASLAWLEEMRRILRPGGLLVLTAHGYGTVAIEESVGRRYPEQFAEIVRTLYEHGFWYRPEFGEEGDWGVKDPEWGTAFMTPEWLLARVTPAWRLAAFAPARVEDNQDLYVLEAR